LLQKREGGGERPIGDIYHEAVPVVGMIESGSGSGLKL
jgi:hypothetical protein